MNDQSERIPVADDYLRALGRATYNFAYLEWDISWLAETLQPGFLGRCSTMTAGNIACCFYNLVDILDDTVADKDGLQALARDFKELVSDRNSLLHGHPHTALTGEQRLAYSGTRGNAADWTIKKMTNFSSRTATASIYAGELLHNGRLQRYHAAK